ncbi:hypothetical protein DIPPA_03305 [Diplonema papillatum]|nr:hypothetical protein DIPPA_03305 [Diplonema papillatum]
MRASLVACAAVLCHYAVAVDQWVVTWEGSQQLTETENLPPSPGLANNTLRQFIHTSAAASTFRLQFSNQYGESEVTFEAVEIAKQGPNLGEIDVSTIQPVAFGGHGIVTIPPNQTVWSDLFAYPLPALSNIAVTIRFAKAPQQVTGHPGSRSTSYLQEGSALDKVMLTGPTFLHWYFLARMDAYVAAPAATLVAFGDSITDGHASTNDMNERWPDDLSAILQGNASTRNISVANAGIGGNCLTEQCLGPAGVSRFSRDVTLVSGVKYCIVLEGVNDIGASVSADVIIEGFRTIVAVARAAGVRVYGSTVLPFGSSMYDTPAHQQVWRLVNVFIQQPGSFDAVIDLATVMQDPDNSTQLNPIYDSGDHLHPNDAGYEKMAQSIPLSLFQ